MVLRSVQVQAVVPVVAVRIIEQLVEREQQDKDSRESRLPPAVQAVAVAVQPRRASMVWVEWVSHRQFLDLLLFTEMVVVQVSSPLEV